MIELSERQRKRVFGHIEKSPNGCWLWTSAKDKDGYGKLRTNGKFYQAHRFFFELVTGSIQDSLVIDHLCSTRNCVNPAHLEQVTQTVNILRSKNRMRLAKTHCKHGHPYTEENTYYEVLKGTKVTRRCKTCMRISYKRYKERLKQI